jgi:hypothetical protein
MIDVPTVHQSFYKLYLHFYSSPELSITTVKAIFLFELFEHFQVFKNIFLSQNLSFPDSSKNIM